MTESALSTSEFFERLDSDFYGSDSTRAKDVTPICWQVYYYISYRLLSCHQITNTTIDERLLCRASI